MQRIEKLEAEKRMASTSGVEGHLVTTTAQRMAPIDTIFVNSTARVTQATDTPTRTPQHPDPDGTDSQQAFVPSPIPSSGGDEQEEDQGLESNAMMGFVGSVDEATSQPYNDSSVTSFMNQIKHLVDQETSHSQTSPASSTRAPAQRFQNRKNSRRRALLNYNLPSRQRADHLLSVYRRLVSTLYPFLDLEEVETLYLRLWTGEDLGKDGLTFLCLINVLFSLACNLDTSISPQHRISDAEVFYDRANELLQLDIVHDPSLLLVQCFLLLGQYLQSSDDPEQCWIFVGFAIRVAQRLRIDVPLTSAKEPVHRQQSMRRVWHGCILMDQILSMTFGRPSMVSSQASVSVPLPLPHPDGRHCQCATDSRTEATDYHFYVETLKLYQIMNETLLLLYNSDSEASPSEDSKVSLFGSAGPKVVGSVLEIEEKLRSWSQNLPPHLRRDAISDRHPTHERQTNVLSIRYNQVRILLFRPIFAKYCSRGAAQNANAAAGEDSLTEKIALQLSVACVKAALEMIENFETVVAGRKVEELDDRLPAWWYSIFYIYTAATVLVATRLDRSLLGEVTEQAIRESWVKAMRILSQFEAFGKHAKQCSTALYLLSNLVIQQTRQQIESRERLSTELRSSSVAPGGQELQTPYDDSPSTIGAGVHTQDWWPSGEDSERLRRKTSTVENLVRHFNTAGIQVDIFGDMSWVTGMPSRRY